MTHQGLQQVRYLFPSYYHLCVIEKGSVWIYMCVYVGVLGVVLSEASSSTRVQEERQIARHVLLCLLLIVCMLAVHKTNTQFSVTYFFE